MIDAISIGFGVIGLTFGAACGWQLYRWERQLTRVRVAVFFKGKSQMTPRLIDWLRWGLTLEGEKATRGQTIYKMGGTTIGLLKPVPRDHGKTVTKEVKEDRKVVRRGDK